MANRSVSLGTVSVGDGFPTYVIAEIGINHNGDLEIAKKLIDVAVLSGCNAVKFQKRTPELCVPPEQRGILRETPWGVMTYLDYRYRVEFSKAQYGEIDSYCKSKGIQWFASPWDPLAVDFLAEFDIPVIKLASASLTDDELIHRVVQTGKPVMLSTGMSTLGQIKKAVSLIPRERLLLAHSTSAYPCKSEELNLRVIETLRQMYPNTPIGYSGHEVGLQASYAAVTLGANFLERHITLDRAMWGTDQAASVEPSGLMRLVRDVRVIEKALGDGVKRVYESELGVMKKLRRVQS